MIGISNAHLAVPSDPKANALFRKDLLNACRKPEIRSRVISLSKQGCVFWIAAFGWQVNPRKGGEELGPFVPWEFQAEAAHKTIKRLWGDGKDIVWEKSRELGATWLALFLFVWCASLHRWKKFLCFTHTVEMLWRPGDQDSLFWKVNFILESLPEWIRTFDFNRSVFTFPGVQSAISGTASTKRTGVGGRATSIFSDETGRQDNARVMVGQTRDTGPRLFVSAHYGPSGQFYELCQRADMHRVVMHWSQHPFKRQGLYRSGGEKGYEILDTAYEFPKDYPFVTTGKPHGGPYPAIRSVWYDQECRERQSDHEVATQLDIDPAGATEQFFDQGTLFALIEECQSPKWEGEVFIDHQEGRILRWVEKRGGPIRIWGFVPGGPCPFGKYGAGSDVGQGRGTEETTPSCLSIGNALTNEKVLEFVTGRVDAFVFGEYCVALCRYFHDALFAWEIPGPGLDLAKRVLDLNYPNVHFRRDERPHKLSPVFSDRPGWVNNAQSKLTLLSSYRAAIQGRVLRNPSARALKECMMFKYTDSGGYVEHPKEKAEEGSRAGAGVSHADIAIGDALMWKMMDEFGIQTKAPELVRAGPKVGSWEWRMALLREQDEEKELAEW